jgi:hypothetical protein
MATAVARGGQVGKGRGGGGVVDGADSHEGRGEGTVGTLGVLGGVEEGRGPSFLLKGVRQPHEQNCFHHVTISGFGSLLII